MSEMEKRYSFFIENDMTDKNFFLFHFLLEKYAPRHHIWQSFSYQASLRNAYRKS